MRVADGSALPRLRPLPTAIALSAALFCRAAPAQDFDLGTHGATVTLPAPWERATFSKDLGNDQFTCAERNLFWKTREVYVWVTESEQVLENRADFERALDAHVTIAHGAVTELSELRGATRASRRSEERINGVALAYRIETVARDGLAFHVLAWATRSDAEFLDAKTDELLAGLSFPGSDSAWQRELVPTARSVTARGRTLSFQIRPFILREQPVDDDRLSFLQSPDDEHCIAVFQPEAYPSADEALDAALAAVGDSGDTAVEVQRDLVDAAGLAVPHLVAKSESYTFHLLAVPLGGGEYLDVRYVSRGTPELPRADRDLFYASLRLTPATAVVEFPPPPPEPVVPLLPALAAIVDRSTQVAEAVDALQSVERLADGRWLARTFGETFVLSADRTPQRVLAREDWGFDVVRWQGRWLVCDREQKVCAVDAGGAVDLPFRARALATLGDDLLLVRAESGGWLPGLGRRMGIDQLVRRRADGSESIVAELRDVGVLAIAASDDGSAVLIACASEEGDIATGKRLLQVDLDDGETRELGAWSSLDAIAPATGGWLVTGQPRAMPAGIWLVAADGAPTAVLTGTDVLGVELRDGRLVFAGPSRAAASGRALLAIALADLGAAGARVQPFAAAHLNEIGARLLSAGGAPPRTESEIRAALDAANAIAQERVGADLPSAAANVDALIGAAVADASELAPEGRILLSLLFARACVDAGAQWIAPAAADWSRWLARAPHVGDSWFAVASSPGTALSAALDDGEAGWHPIDDLASHAEGRALLLGLEEESMRAALAAATPPQWHDALERADATALLAVLRERAGNSFARARLYERLAARGELSAVEAIAREIGASDAATAVDAMAWLSAWTERATEPPDLVALVAAATEAMHRYPAEAALCYCLGRAYERLSPGAPERALACYRRVVEMEQWGDAAKAARAAIERLGG
jgi:hypothetical protein